MAKTRPDPMQNPLVQESVALLQRLLTPARTRTQLVSGRPIVPAGGVGALAVVGMKTEAPKTWVSVYIYPSWDAATAGMRTLEAKVGDTAGKWIISALNGRMVLYGWGAGEGEKAPLARYVLNNILAAFEDD